MRPLRHASRVALAVPGQGSQAVGMGKTLHASYPASRKVFDRVEAALKMPLSKIMFEGPAQQLTRTSYAQPAILTHAVACFEALKSERHASSVRDIAKVALGHSVGEIAALCIAEAISLEDAATLLHLRGEAMQKAVPTGGAMAALLPIDEATATKISEEAKQETDINSPDQVVISGMSNAVARASELSKKHGVRRVIPLEVSAPFHCRLMAPAAEALAAALASLDIKPPVIPVLSNVTGREHEASAEAIRRALIEQVTAPVRWHACMLRARDNLACEQLLELGPGEVLSSLARKLKLEATPMATAAQVRDAVHGKEAAAQSIYDFQALGIDRKTTVDMKEYRGKVLLVVNVASKCGYTPQYTGLEALYRKHKDAGLVVLGFPCDQFGHQEPGTEDQIAQFCSRTFNVTFPMFAKIDVNGPHTHPLWSILKVYNQQNEPIKWNFTKFLVDKSGKVVQRFAPSDTPSDIEKHIAKLL